MSTRKRLLAAIVFTDIVGYSAIMSADEEQARRVRDRHRSVFQESTERHNGQILQYYGDGTLSIFHSSVEAVESCIEIQRELQQEPRIPLRIGIHTGDIILEEQEVLGDGVNVAARLESACLPGGILISAKVHDDIKNHADLRCQSLGKHFFKNIPEPIELFSVADLHLPSPPVSEWQEAVRKAKKLEKDSGRSGSIRRTNRLLMTGLAIVGAFTLLLSILYLTQGPSGERNSKTLAHSSTFEEKPVSIAVLPFVNYSEEKDEYFSDGITEDILTLLSRLKGIHVISRTTMMRYKDTQKSIREIGDELEADYVLEGSVRRQENKVRIVAQLIDARTDDHLWAQTYDREITEIFEIQSQVATDIATALKMQLSPSQEAGLGKKGTANVEAYDMYLQGRNYYFEYTEKDNESAIQLFQNAIALDSLFAPAYAGLGDALAQKAVRFPDKKPFLLDSAMTICQRAIALDPQLSDAYKAKGLVYHYQEKPEEAMDAYLEALKYNASNGMATLNISSLYLEKGELADAYRWAQKALQLNPKDRWTHEIVAVVYTSLGMYDKAIELLEGALRLYPDFDMAAQRLFYLYFELGNLEKAANYAKLCGELMPESGYEPRFMGLIELSKGNLRKARALFETAPSTKGKEKNWEADLAYVFTLRKLGNPQAFDLIRNYRQEFQDLKLRKDGPDYYYVLCLLDAAQGNNDSALNYLQQAAAYNWLYYNSAQANPLFTDLRTNPRFFEIIQGVKGKVDRMRREVELLD